MASPDSSNSCLTPDRNVSLCPDKSTCLPSSSVTRKILPSVRLSNSSAVSSLGAVVAFRDGGVEVRESDSPRDRFEPLSAEGVILIDDEEALLPAPNFMNGFSSWSFAGADELVMLILGLGPDSAA